MTISVDMIKQILNGYIDDHINMSLTPEGHQRVLLAEAQLSALEAENVRLAADVNKAWKLAVDLAMESRVWADDDIWLEKALKAFDDAIAEQKTSK